MWTLFLFLIYSANTIMEFKFLLITLMVAIFLAQYEASSKTCPRWVKLNKSPVCFGARGNQFGRFSYQQNIFVSSFMLVHRSGKVTCDKSDKVTTATGDVNQITKDSLYSWLIRTTRYWLQKHQPLARVDGIQSGRIQFFLLSPCVLCQKQASRCLC